MNRWTDAFTDELRAPRYRGNPDPMAGHCYVACEVLAWVMPDLKPQFVRVDGEPHWFLRDPNGKVIDPTASQFSQPVPYDKGRGCGFLTKTPSKRARVVINRLFPGELP